jgi:hypothetical protein
MHLVQLLFLLYSVQAFHSNRKRFAEVRNELVDRFGGITAYTTCSGDWTMARKRADFRDDLIIYEIIVEKLEEDWWRQYRALVENRFQQKSIVVRTREIRVL